MLPYIFRRLFLIFPTLIGILLVNFIIIQAVPGGPIDRILLSFKEEQLTSLDVDKLQSTGPVDASPTLRQELIEQFGFNEPAYKRFFKLVKSYLSFDLGTSYFSNRSVLSLILERLPVSLSLGIWTTLLSYLLSVPLGIQKAI